MCRIMAIAPAPSRPIDSEIIRSFRYLAVYGKVKLGASSGHPDGWGIVSWLNDKPTYLGREPTDAVKDPKFDAACDRIDQLKIEAPIIAHLRKASRGTKTKENTHPFVKGVWAFAHNGVIRRAKLRSRTDSEWFFEALFEEIDRTGGDLRKALSMLVKSVHEVYNYSSLTFVLSNGHELFAYRDYSNFEDYYTMYFAKTASGLVVSQERFFDASWHELANHELLEVGKELTVTVQSL